ncbi:hypothetical protein F5148DRAFT_1369421 [Russula earlei]|uniref:Uncharacterized protein n=1 Tax=Russula earlei TaxID=71964 RepID=A0ACC0U2K9_9AGAM|nr:hypothetical protein F5148DRAFT_1369421 [Russula earlei]
MVHCVWDDMPDMGVRPRDARETALLCPFRSPLAYSGPSSGGGITYLAAPPSAPPLKSTQRVAGPRRTPTYTTSLGGSGTRDDGVSNTAPASSSLYEPCQGSSSVAPDLKKLEYESTLTGGVRSGAAQCGQTVGACMPGCSNPLSRVMVVLGAVAVVAAAAVAAEASAEAEKVGSKEDVCQAAVARVDDGARVGGDVMEREAWCGVVLASTVSPVVTAWRWGLIFLQGGVAVLSSKALVFLGGTGGVR